MRASEATPPESKTASESYLSLPPSKGKLIQRDSQEFQKNMMMDIASLLTHSSDGTDLIEAFCSHNSMLTKVAQKAGLKCERWTVDDFDLATEEGYDQAEARLRELKPRRIWLSPECGPLSQLQNANQRTEEQVENLKRKREEGLK